MGCGIYDGPVSGRVERVQVRLEQPRVSPRFLMLNVTFGPAGPEPLMVDGDRWEFSRKSAATDARSPGVEYLTYVFVKPGL